MRCLRCSYYNFDFLSDSYEEGESFCGLHGRAKVDPNGKQRNLDNHGSCGYHPKNQPIQMSLNFD